VSDDDEDDYECPGYAEHDYPPLDEGDECRRCGAEAGVW
jgi:hypothetical protein